jgi:peptidoglycan/LPS O-acetylase OafA/YrhL
MNRAFSVYLDLVRFIAACLVYVYHSNQRALIQDILPASSYGHSAVIVFFVLSGFVIAFVTDTKERNWPAYAASRLSRVYSVAVPAVLLTLLLDAVGRSLAPALYANYPFDQIALRSGISIAMLNEVWFVSVTSFSNVPFWSICYETWYYAAFGVAMFLSRGWAVPLLLGLALLLGPKIVLLAPIWLSGVLLYRWKFLEIRSTPLALALGVLSIAGVIAFHALDMQTWGADILKSVVGPSLQEQLTFSKFFLSDYILTLLVLANFVAMRKLTENVEQVWRWIETPVRFLAGYTFTLYLLHQPLFLFWGSVLRGDPTGYLNWVVVTVLTAVSVIVVGHFTESRRHVLRAWLLGQFERLAGSRKVGRSNA